jgi:hypothetical protein
MKPLLASLLALSIAQGAFAQGESTFCASLAGQISELRGAKANVEQLNEQSTTSLGVNPQSENFIIPHVMERVDAQRREAEALRQSIETRKASMFYEWDYGIRADIERYNLLLASIKRDLGEIQSRQDTALQQVALNKATYGYDRTVEVLERSQSLYASRGCKQPPAAPPAGAQ